MAKFHIFPGERLSTLPAKTVAAITAELSTMKIENELRKEMRDNIQRLRDMGSYRGKRHAMGLPVRGQRTRSQVCANFVRNGTVLMEVDRDGKEAEPRRETKLSGNYEMYIWKEH
jgi:ribosomal protein S13